MADKTTQKFIPIEEVRDGVAILKDGSLRVILIVSSINFSLKSQDEREAILLQYQNFLNSLDFTIQIHIQSRRMDITPYLALLEERQREQVNELMKIQTKEYIGFVRNFTDNTNIMSKNFFVVIPYKPAVLSSRKGKRKKKGKRMDDSSFEQHKSQLIERTTIVEQGLARVGVRSVQLGTEEITELFYKIFNPGDTGSIIKTG